VFRRIRDPHPQDGSAIELHYSKVCFRLEEAAAIDPISSLLDRAYSETSTDLTFCVSGHVP